MSEWVPGRTRDDRQARRLAEMNPQEALVKNAVIFCERKGEWWRGVTAEPTHTHPHLVAWDYRRF